MPQNTGSFLKIAMPACHSLHHLNFVGLSHLSRLLYTQASGRFRHRLPHIRGSLTSSNKAVIPDLGGCPPALTTACALPFFPGDDISSRFLEIFSPLKGVTGDQHIVYQSSGDSLICLVYLYPIFLFQITGEFTFPGENPRFSFLPW